MSSGSSERMSSRSRSVRRLTVAVGPNPDFTALPAASFRSAPPRRRLSSAAAGVVPAARAGVAGAGALHHPAALLARGAELEALAARGEHRRSVGEGGGGG